MHIGYFRGVANAEAIRDLIRDRLKAYRSAGLGDEPDHAGHEDPDGDTMVEALKHLRNEMAALRATIAPSGDSEIAAPPSGK